MSRNDRRTRVVIVGCGDGGRSNAASFSGINEAEVVAFCDPNVERLSQAVNDFGGNGYIDLGVMLDSQESDLVVVATPDPDHLGPARMALKAGRRVFVEKPVATSMAHLEEFSELNSTYPNHLYCGEKYAFAGPAWSLITRRPPFGRFLFGHTAYVMWRCGRIMGDGKWRTETDEYSPWAGGLSHNLMIARLLAGCPIVEVQAWGSVQTYRELEQRRGYDIMAGTVRFKDGQFLTCVVSLAMPGSAALYGQRTVAHTFQFEHGGLVYGARPQDDRLFITDGQEIITLNFDREPFDDKWSEEKIRDEWGEYNRKLYRRMHRDLLAAIRGDSQPLHSIEDGINVAAACAMAFESARDGGQPKRVPF